MSLPMEKKRPYTYGDYLRWPEGRRVEIIEGRLYNMGPAPSRYQQEVRGELFRQIANFLWERSDNPCRVYAAPFDLRLPEHAKEDEATETVVQPDILVVCDPDKLDEKGCRGAPDFIAEIVSPSSAARDQIEKTALYEKHGVREYWIVHPTDGLVFIRTLSENGRYGPLRIRAGNGRLALSVLPELEIDLDAVFGNPPDGAAAP